MPRYGAHIDTNTPQGLRAKQTMDMLNSDWPIGPVGVRTLAAPDMVDDVGTKMDKIWWDRPFTVTGVDIGAGQATLHVLTSYGVAQDIELRTNDAGLVDRFDVSLQPPVIKSWARHRRRADQVGRAVLISGVARCPRRTAKCATGRGHQHRPVAPAGVDLQTLCAACGCRRGQRRERCRWTDPAHHHQGGQRRSGRPASKNSPPGAQVSVRRRPPSR